MKIVSISLDPKVLDSNSVVSSRNRLYGQIVDEYSVIVHDAKDSVLELNEDVTVYGVGGMFKITRLIRVCLLLRRLVKEDKCDVISSSDPYFFGFVAFCVAKMNHVGFEAHILGIEKLNFFRKTLGRFFIKHAGAIRVNSTRLRDRVSKEFNVPVERITFVPIYVPTDELGFQKAHAGSTNREKQDLSDKNFLDEYGAYFNFLFVGRLVGVKNIPMQLKAMRKIKGLYPDVRLHIVGDGPDREVLQQQVSRLGVASQVVFHGRKEGIALGTYYRLCDSLILTSFAEGWPMVIFESMIAGLPIIMTDVGCAGEMIKDDVNGLIIPSDDYEVLAQAMERFMSEEGLMKRLVGHATRDIQNYWTRDQILAGYKQSWRKALDNKF